MMFPDPAAAITGFERRRKKFRPSLIVPPLSHRCPTPTIRLASDGIPNAAERQQKRGAWFVMMRYAEDRPKGSLGEGESEKRQQCQIDAWGHRRRAKKTRKPRDFKLRLLLKNTSNSQLPDRQAGSLIAQTLTLCTYLTGTCVTKLTARACLTNPHFTAFCSRFQSVLVHSRTLRNMVKAMGADRVGQPLRDSHQKLLTHPDSLTR